jgi:hypothetical protein
MGWRNIFQQLLACSELVSEGYSLLPLKCSGIRCYPGYAQQIFFNEL